MLPNLDNFVITHLQSENRFEALVQGQTAVLNYHLVKGGISLDHTFVPPTLEGRGVAAKLVRAALDFARSQNLQVRPVCSYVAAYIEKHAEYQDLLSPRS